MTEPLIQRPSSEIIQMGHTILDALYNALKAHQQGTLRRQGIATVGTLPADLSAIYTRVQRAINGLSP